VAEEDCRDSDIAVNSSQGSGISCQFERNEKRRRAEAVSVWEKGCADLWPIWKLIYSTHLRHTATNGLKKRPNKNGPTSSPGEPSC
jgi:hypothetical protein